MNFDEMKDAFLCGWFFLKENESNAFDQQLTQVLELASRNCSSFSNMARKLTVYESVTRCVGCGSWGKHFKNSTKDTTLVPTAKDLRYPCIPWLARGDEARGTLRPINKQTNKTYLKQEKQQQQTNETKQKHNPLPHLFKFQLRFL